MTSGPALDHTEFLHHWINSGNTHPEIMLSVFCKNCIDLPAYRKNIEMILFYPYVPPFSIFLKFHFRHFWHHAATNCFMYKRFGIPDPRICFSTNPFCANSARHSIAFFLVICMSFCISVIG